MNYRAVTIGFLADIGATHLFVLALLIVLYDPGSSSVCLAERIAHPVVLDLFCLICGLALTGMGGFVAARLAKRDLVSHGMAVGCLSLVASIILCAGSTDPFSLLGYLLTIPMAAFGAMASACFPQED
ncbi:hypothetical protein DYH09_23895 [bacterium CPR1]|nr:hypothetical protein [bacterium CPR1]